VPTEEREQLARGFEPCSSALLTWLRVTIKRKTLVWRSALAIVVLGCAAALLMPNRYTATVVILPPQQGGASGAAMMAQMGSLGAMASAAGSMGIKNPNDQQVALLKSRSLEDAMATRFHLQARYHRKYLSATRERWERVTNVENGLKDGLIRLSVTDRDPRQAADMANAWVEEYRRFTATLAITEASQRRLFFERQLSAAHEDLARAEEDMQKTEQRTGVIEIESQARAMIASAAVLRGQLAAKQVEIRAMREFAADQNPDLMRAEQELTGMEGQLAAMDAASDRSTGDLVAPKGTVTQASLDYTRALREVKYRETIQDLLTRQYEGARVDEARQGTQVQVVDPAVVPDRPTSLYRLWIALGALAVSLPLALLAALIAELMAILLDYRRRSGSWPAALEEAVNGAWL
jgi:tyrosine-protein kinase Etk/Wzc